MVEERVPLAKRRLRTPRTAAVAGMLFAVLLSTSYILIRLSIAFLWFIGVVRDLLGQLEDRFFSSVFFGSGLLYLAMMFSSAALAGGLLASYAIEANKLVESGLYTFARLVMYRIANIYAIRMAGVFMISLGTVWMQTRVLPRWLVFLTYIAALVLLLSIGYSLWVTLIFPVWVFIISLYILILNMRSPHVNIMYGDEAASDLT
jgi:hypothetical protein